MDQHSSYNYKNADKKEAKCPYCQRMFHSQDELTLHIVTRHTHKGKPTGLAQTGGLSKR